MAAIDKVTNILRLDTGGLALVNNDDIKKQAEERLRWYIGDNYDDVYKRSISVTSVTNVSGGIAEFYAVDHKLGYKPFTERITTTGFSEETYNVTNQFAHRVDRNKFYIEKRYYADVVLNDRYVAYVSDVTGTVKTAFYDDYELAEAYLICSLAIHKLKMTNTGQPIYDAKEYGEGHIKPASQSEYMDLSNYYKKQAEKILVRLGYSTLRFI